MDKWKIVFFGTDDFSLPALKRLVNSDFSIAAAVTKPDSRAGRGRKTREPAVKLAAQAAGVPVLQPDKVLDIKDKLEGLSASHGILAAYGKILPPRIIDIFPGGIINIHPSLLPKYRGPSPIEAAIINGDDETGISLMELTSGMDEGPVYAQENIKISPSANRVELGVHLAEAGADMLIDSLEGILDGSLKPKPQDDSKATYTKLIKKEDGRVDWDKPAQQLEREVRAYFGWPKSPAKVGAHDVIITKARVAKSMGDGHLVAECGQGYLEIQELVAPSGRTMSGAEFQRGYRA